MAPEFEIHGVRSSGALFHNSVNILVTTELYTLKWLKW